MCSDRLPITIDAFRSDKEELAMLARLGLNRLPPLLFPLIFALAAAMVLGGTLAYVLKPPTLVTGRTQVLVIHDNADSSPRADACIWTNRKSAC